MKKFAFSFLAVVLVFLCSCSENPTLPESSKDPILKSFSGPEKCQVNQKTIFEAVGFDPDGTKISFHFQCWIEDPLNPYAVDLGWTSYVANNEVYKKEIIWTKPGGYISCCFCKDEEGRESNHIQLGVEVDE